MGDPLLMNDDLLDLLGKLYVELQIARLLRISFAEFAADHEEHLHTAAMLYIGGGLRTEDSIQDDAECMSERRELGGLLPELYRVPIS